jgi:hypothetical protein
MGARLAYAHRFEEKLLDRHWAQRCTFRLLVTAVPVKSDSQNHAYRRKMSSSLTTGRQQSSTAKTQCCPTLGQLHRDVICSAGYKGKAK